MTPDDFASFHKRLGISRAALCDRLGLSPNSGMNYALGKTRIPRYIALACAAVAYGLAPMGGEPVNPQSPRPPLRRSSEPPGP